MAKILILLSDWISYLEGRVNIDVYVYGGNGELFINQLNKVCELEKVDHTETEAFKNVDRVLTLVQKRILQGVDIFIIRGEDCSGLAIKFLLDKEIIKHDMTANGLFKLLEAYQIPLKDVRAGDYLFQGTDSNKWHVGYAISEKYAIESKNHDVGVVQTKISERGWKYACRPDWYSDAPIPPKPEKPVLKRELYFKKDADGKIEIRGEDVKDAQLLLTDKGYNPGVADGIFGNNTMIATKNFQHDNNLDEDGVIGKITGTALGFKWEG